MEKIRDLLDNSKDNLRLREDPRKGVWLEDLTEAYVNSRVNHSDCVEVFLDVSWLRDGITRVVARVVGVGRWR